MAPDEMIDAEATVATHAAPSATHRLVPRLSRPTRYLVRMLVFLTLIGFLAYILHGPIVTAFMTNPGLNGLICGTLAVGILMALNETRLLYRETGIGNAVKLRGDLGALSRSSVLAALLPALDKGQMGQAQTANVLESISVRLDDGREVIRYLAGLLVFLGLLGTFWGLLETVGSVGNVIKTLRTGGESSVLFDELKSGLAAPLAGMGLSFSSSLFGIAGSLVLGFLDLQLGQAQRRMRNQIEDWLNAIASVDTPFQPAENAAGAQAMARLADGVQGLIQNMRQEQQLIRDWVEAQATREKDLKQLLERMAAVPPATDRPETDLPAGHTTPATHQPEP